MKSIVTICFLFFSLQSFTQDNRNKDTLVIGIGQEFESLHPHIMAMGASRYLQNIINRPLVTLNPESKWIPMLAEDVPSGKKVTTKKENGIYKTVATWTIRANAKWSDGVDITCADFVYSLEVGKNPLVQIANKEIYDKIDRIEFDKTKPKVCQFVYTDNSWNFYQMPEFFPLPVHLDKEIFESNKSEKNGYTNKNIYSLDKATKAVYSGPFKVTEIKPGSHIVLERNPHFFQQPFFSKIILKIVPNSNTFEAHIKSGTLDIVAPIGITFDQALDFEKRWASEKEFKHQVVFKEGAAFEHLSFNMDMPLFKDLKVRQALIFSINREELSKNFFAGKQAVADFYHPRLCPWFPKNVSKIKTYKYSIKTAEKLLEDAGWKKNEDGFRYKDGQKLEFSFSTTAGNAIRENVQVYMKNEWKKIGADVTIKNFPARTLFGEVAKKRQFQGVIMHAWHVAPETAPVGFLASKNIPSESNSWSGFNFGAWNSPAWDKLSDKLFLATSLEKRKSIVVEMLNVYTSELPDIPLYYKTEVAIIPKTLKNFRLAGHTFPETNEIETWRY